MNILFYTPNEVSPEIGGTERTTTNVTSALTKYYGFKCYSMYSERIPDNYIRTKFVDTICLDNFSDVTTQEKLRKFIVKYQIDILVNQGIFGLTKEFRKSVDGLCTKIILVHHFEPGGEILFLRFKSVFNYPVRCISEVAKICKSIVLYPFNRYMAPIRLRRAYKEGVNFSDKVVLLSRRFIPEFCRYAGIDNTVKMDAINNALSFDMFYDVDKLSEKKHYVLIVSRLDESHKKISLALKVWRLIEKNTELNGWNLKILGKGNDEMFYRKLVEKMQLKRVVFEGVKDPLPYYEEASLFMMTSVSEGWGLTLTEAQQMGCVPIAFDTYSSLYDIISNDENGIIVPWKNLEEYANKMTALMINEEYRMRIAKASILSAHRFTQESIGRQWFNLLSKI
ncbi:glycosyltransferase [Bacteroides sp. KFT8]|uniref:glycosyltransferase n=1 Tax=Bacteroides sp. KFT8 TaxID=2025659 RepID=UPI0039B53A2B